MNKKEIEAYKRNVSQQKAPDLLIKNTLRKIEKQQKATGKGRKHGFERNRRNKFLKGISAIAAVFVVLIVGSLLFGPDKIIINEITGLDINRIEFGQIHTEKEQWTVKQLEEYINKSLTQPDAGWELQSENITLIAGDRGETKTILASLTYRGSNNGTVHISLNKKINQKIFEENKESKIKKTPVYFFKEGQNYFAFFTMGKDTYLVDSEDFNQKTFIQFIKFLIK